MQTLQEFASNKKSGYERESAAICYNSLAVILGPSVAPLLLTALQTLFDLYMDKGDVVRVAATSAVKSILKQLPPEATRTVFRTLESILENGKWRSKVGVLDSFKPFVNSARDFVAAELGSVLPKVEIAMHDTKPEVSSAAIKCATSLCSTLANPDLSPHIPILVKCMANPDQVPTCIKAMSSTTFVAEVTAPALAVLVPMLLRALNDRSIEVQRRTVVVIDNLVKLVRDPKVAAIYLSPLVEGVRKIATGAAFPEVVSGRILDIYTPLTLFRFGPSATLLLKLFSNLAHLPAVLLLSTVISMGKHSRLFLLSSPFYLRNWAWSCLLFPMGQKYQNTHFSTLLSPLWLHLLLISSTGTTSTTQRFGSDALAYIWTPG